MQMDPYNESLPSLLVQAARSAAEADGLRPPETVAKESIENEKAAAVLATLTAEKKAAEDAAMERARSAIASAQQQQKKPDPVHVPSAGIAAHMMAAQAQASQSLTQPRKSAATNASNATSPMPQPTSTSSASSSKKKGPPLRRGKWTPEEEAYANRLILEFKAGLLPLTDGTTLRTFLSKLLNCDPMRISKKFVGSNCIGKQVFRRRTADINRLTPEQIQQSRAELSDLERRFLERVAQTNRVKSSGVGSSQTQGPPGANAQEKKEMESSPPSPPWLQTPMGYKQGQGAAMAAAALGGAANNRAAAAGRALLGGDGGLTGAQKKPSLSSHGSAGLLAFAELQRRSQQNLLQSAMGNQSSASNLLAAASAGASSSSGLSSSAMAQIARNASAARLAGLTAAGNSMNNLMMKTGLSRDQLTQLAREQGMTSSASLSNMMERQSSFDALMSLDFQSLQSIDNLANLIQTGGGLPGNVPEMGMKNWSSDGGTGNGLTAPSSTAAGTSSGNLSGSLANARRLASAGRMESLLRSLSSNNVKKEDTLNSSSNSSGVNGGSPQVGLVGGGGSNANFSNLLQSMQSNLNGLGGGNSNNSLFGSGANAASALSLANMLRADSSTGLTALRMQDGLTQRNTSVDDFLSLVASGDIPHQDPTLLNVPLMQQQAQQAAAIGGGSSGAQAAANYLAQQQLLVQAANSGNAAAFQSALAQAGSFGNLRNGSVSSLARAAGSQSQLGGEALKRKLMEMEGVIDGQGGVKR